METLVENRLDGGDVVVTVRVRLTPRESGRMFLAGDVLIRLPLAGATADPSVPVPRESLFLSELAEARDGYTRRFHDAASAGAYEAAVRDQLQQAALKLAGEHDA